MILGVFIELRAVQKMFSLYYSVLILETSSLILFFFCCWLFFFDKVPGWVDGHHYFEPKQ